MLIVKCIGYGSLCDGALVMGVLVMGVLVMGGGVGRHNVEANSLQSFLTHLNIIDESVKNLVICVCMYFHQHHHMRSCDHTEMQRGSHVDSSMTCMR